MLGKAVFFVILQAEELEAAGAGGKEGSWVGSAEGGEPGLDDSGGSAP